MPAYNNVYKALEGQIMVETSKAILFRVVDKEAGSTVKQEWFPKSHLASFGGTYDEIEGTFNFIMATEWILGQKGLLSKAVDKSSIKDTRTATASPNMAAPYTGTTKQDKANRLPYKDDESAFDDYYQGLMHDDAGDRG